MEMKPNVREIKLTVCGDTVHASRHRAGVQGECNATALVVSFDESWDGYAKKITFWDALEQNPVERFLTDDLLVDGTYRTTIPGEPLAEAGECTLVIDGWVEGTRARSMEVRLGVDAAPTADHAGEPVDPMPDQYEQLLSQIVTGAERAEHGAERSEQAAAQAEGYTSNPPKIGDNGNWWQWDGEAYVDTGAPSRGEQGQQGVQGVQGIQGERGPSGVYVGSGDMPEDCNVQIVPDGEPVTVEMLVGIVLAAIPNGDEVGY